MNNKLLRIHFHNKRMKLPQCTANFCLAWTSFKKETVWSLILYIVFMYTVCMYVACDKLCKIDHSIHTHWCIPMGLEHNDLWVKSHICDLKRNEEKGHLGVTDLSVKIGSWIYTLWCISMGVGHKWFLDIVAHVMWRQS